MTPCKRIPNACRDWLDDLSPKILYKAIREGRCEALRPGGGRNLRVTEEQIKRWLESTVRKPTTAKLLKIS
jgi:excisionase family DNA binding protein